MRRWARGVRTSHREVVVAAEEGPEPEALGGRGHREQIVVGGTLLGLGEDAQVGELHPLTLRVCGQLRSATMTSSPDLPPLPHAFDALRAHVLAHSVKRGEFTLKSGATSSWFLDTKQTACRPDGIVLVADALLEVLGHSAIEADAIGGLTMGADPVAFGVAAVAATRGSRCAASASARKPRTTGSPAGSPAR
jgi:hypothetical protein